MTHQHFITTTLPKIRRVRRMIELAKATREVEVDGGIDPETAPLAVTVGADVLVAGTAIFNEGENVAAAMTGCAPLCSKSTSSVRSPWATFAGS